MDKFVCVHGHFYQPPRENPWLEAVELQESAYPHHDWNHRITFECYAPNAASRILDAHGLIAKIVNNYASMSFNVGPTLLSWMQASSPRVYQSILDADRESRERFSGHGSAMAQAYNHMILPLALERDRRTQIRWGIRDFTSRFGRSPEGMWLPETAVDLGSLDMMAAEGILFTVLAPRQASRVRAIAGGGWKDVSDGSIDPTRPYRVRLPSGRDIAIFFYEGPIAQAIAFEGLLGDGERFGKRLLDGFSGRDDGTHLVHVATDGESYGHHHRHGEMALSYALRWLEENGHAKLTNYGEFLERFPPTHEAEIQEKSSWSCVHGVDRWFRDCGCAQGRDSSWSQAWRTPLRSSFDWVRDTLAPLYEKAASALLHDPWAARDGYIDLILDRSEASREAFWSRHARRDLDGREKVRALGLLEIQRNAMLMYTSCGWFFDDVSGIEAVQVMRYAGRVVQRARDTLGPTEGTGPDLEVELLDRLAQARSNVPDQGDAASIYRRRVMPAVITLEKVGAHYAISSLFGSYAEQDEVYCYGVRRLESHRREAGQSKLIAGRIRVESRVTGASKEFSYGVYHLGDHNIQAGVREFRGDEAFESFAKQLTAAFDGGESAEVIRILDRQFGGVTYSLRSLFLDRQREITEEILEKTIEEAEGRFRDIYRQHAPLMRYLSDGGVAPPAVLRTAAQLVINSDLRRILKSDAPDLERVSSVMESARAERVELDATGLAFALGRAIRRLMERFQAEPSDEEGLGRLLDAVKLARSLPIEVNLWSTQNKFYDVLQETYPALSARLGGPEGSWGKRFAELAKALSVRIAPATPPVRPDPA